MQSLMEIFWMLCRTVTRSKGNKTIPTVVIFTEVRLPVNPICTSCGMLLEVPSIIIYLCTPAKRAHPVIIGTGATGDVEHAQIVTVRGTDKTNIIL